jgi:hypothetical protein
MGTASPEKAGVRRFDPVSGHHLESIAYKAINQKPSIREAFTCFA